MDIYKVVSRNLKHSNQVKKKIYVGDVNYNKYSNKLIDRWSLFFDIEVYKLNIDGEYELMFSIKFPRTKEELKKLQFQRGLSEHWFEVNLNKLEL